ncbi:MAG: hydantoinase B/oxoprolinase family protein [Pseudomonadota bacterium]
MSAGGDVGEIRLQVMWNRLIAIVEEQARTLVRAAFSPAVREGGDLSAGVFDVSGKMLAQAVTGTPGHVNTMATAITHFLKRFPADGMRPGDVLITNDPWLGSGHLHDVTIVTPAFKNDRVVGLFAATVHIVDVGGRGMGPDGRSLFEEGVLIPIMPLARGGTVNEDLLSIMLANSREPFQVQGDLLAIMAAGNDGAGRLTAMLDEFGVDDLRAVSDFIVERSRAATRAALARLKPGRYESAMRIDGYDEPVDLVAAMQVCQERISVDFAGTSAESSYGINVCHTYTRAYTTYGLMCAAAPLIPNNYGSMGCFEINAPEGSILNARRPAPVSARHIIGHALPDVVFGCLEQCVPDGVSAQSGMMWNPYFRGHHGGRAFEMFLFNAGGMGARADADGMNATAFPSGIKNIPVEAAENAAPVIFHRKELLPDTGGPGQFRGGLGQVVEIGPAAGTTKLQFSAMFDRVENAAAGRYGGAAGAAGDVAFSGGGKGKSKGAQPVPEGETVILSLPGGGGTGPVSERDPNAVRADVKAGYVTPEAAIKDYSVDVSAPED